jgi:hypothetical protein
LFKATSIGRGATPKEGDFMLCINCGGILRFGDALQLVVCSAPEMTELTLEDRDRLLIASLYIRARRSGVNVQVPVVEN